MREQIKDELQLLVTKLGQLLTQAEPYKNEAWLLDLVDDINKLSIMY